MLAGDRIDRVVSFKSEKPMPRSHHQPPAESWEGNIRGLRTYVITGVNVTQSLFFSHLKISVSDDRLEPYRKGQPQSDLAAYATYAWNIALCESLYPALNGVEIALRNSIHDSATQKFGTDLWFNSRLKNPEKERLDKLRKQLDPSGVKPLTAGDFVSGLTLGFWVDLFKRRYEQILWPWLLRPVFNYAPRRQISREPLYQRLDEIRYLRNRVFHHEPIWHLPDLEHQHQQILETIGWISPAMLGLINLLDRFPSVYTDGTLPYTTELDFLAQNWSA